MSDSEHNDFPHLEIPKTPQNVTMLYPPYRERIHGAGNLVKEPYPIESAEILPFPQKKRR